MTSLETNTMVADFIRAKIRDKVDDPDLAELLCPTDHAFGSKRLCVDHGYFEAFNRDNVALVSVRDNPIEQITESGIRLADGTQHDVDVIVYATGFHATEYLFPMKIVGRDGKTVEDMWKDGGARAYRCSMIPGFPNLWSLYGPNTNGALNVPTFHEMVMLYAMQCMEKLIAEGKRSVEPTEDAYWRFAEEMDERNRRKVWSDSRVQSYYWTRFNRSATQNPFNTNEMWHLLRKPDYGELAIR